VSEDTSYQERLAFAVTGTVLGVTVEPYDRNGRQRAVDAILHYSDDRTAVLEVSSTDPDDEAPTQHFLGDRGRSKVIPGVACTWIVELPQRFHPASMRRSKEHCADARSGDSSSWPNWPLPTPTPATTSARPSTPWSWPWTRSRRSRPSTPRPRACPSCRRPGPG
jgi:hypothetical protein